MLIRFALAARGLQDEAPWSMFQVQYLELQSSVVAVALAARLKESMLLPVEQVVGAALVEMQDRSSSNLPPNQQTLKFFSSRLLRLFGSMMMMMMMHPPRHSSSDCICRPARLESDNVTAASPTASGMCVL